MKIAEPESIKAGEEELISSIMEHLNSEIIKSIASGRLAVNNLEFRNGDMVIHENRIVYKMEFETSVAISVLFDREGNLIDENPEVTDPPETSRDDEMSGLSVEENSEDDDEDMERVMEKTREFWVQQSRDAMEAVETEGIVNEDDQFSEVMKKNREFWQDQVEMNTASE